MNDVRTGDASSEVSRVLEIGPKSGTKRRRWLMIAAAVAAVLAATVAYFVWPKPVTYVTGAVGRGPIDVKVTATGTLQPVNEVQVGVEVSGTIRTVSAEANDRVKKGDVLAAIDTDQLNAKLLASRANLGQARAGLVDAGATLKQARLSFDRTQQLAQTGNASTSALDNARAALDRAQAGLARAKAQVTLAEASVASDETALSKAIIHAPIDGIVLSRNVEPGQTVAAAFQTPILFTLADDLAKMELHVDIDEADIGLVQDGQGATFTVDAYPGRIFKARITSVHNAPKTLQGVVTYEGVLAVDNPDLALKPGMTATADILVEHVDDALTVPAGALRFVPEGAAEKPPEPLGDANRSFRGQVYRLERGRPVAAPVVAGASDGTRTEIREGQLKEGENVILDIQRKKKAKAR